MAKREPTRIHRSTVAAVAKIGSNRKVGLNVIAKNGLAMRKDVRVFPAEQIELGPGRQESKTRFCMFSAAIAR